MGRVDDISDDGRYLWLLQDSGAGRRLLDRAEGYTTFLDSKLQWERSNSAAVDLMPGSPGPGKG